MRINDFNEILEKYDFFESIIDEVYFYDNFNVKIKVYYFWDNEEISDKENVIIGFENCHTLNINIEKALTSCKRIILLMLILKLTLLN